ncbi:MAG: hypothetical protein AAF499_03410 [Pseudomonadota bacterium]
MKLTRFSRLEYAASLLGGKPGVSLLANQLAESVEFVDPDTVVFGETGIYRLSPGGALTQVAFYRSDNDIDGERLGPLFERHAHHGGFNAQAVVDALHVYHLVECPLLVHAALHNWQGEYAISQNAAGRFHVSFTRGAATVIEVDDQRLAPCPECLKRLNARLGRHGGFDAADFQPGSLLGQPFERVPLGSTAPNISCRSVPESLRADWARIEKAFLALGGYQCEGESCTQTDFSAEPHRQLMQAHYVGHDIGHPHFAQIQSLCVRCHAQEPDHGYLRNRVSYHRYEQIFGDI